MSGRDPFEVHRGATPLELLFDLTFVIAFGLAASQFAHAIAEAHLSTGLIGFSFASFAICWAWVNFSWFASAYDTDDWIFRVATIVQMIGVVVFAIGLPRLFSSLETGGLMDISVMVLGYVVMRCSMVFLWLRAAGHDPSRRDVCLTYAKAISIVQIGWVVLIILPLQILPTLVSTMVLTIAELAGPFTAERRGGGTPWHAGHLAERFGLFAIIALGEGVIGTVATLNAVLDGQGWSLNVAVICFAGVGLTFGMWWTYYIIPSSAVLRSQRGKGLVWGYTQLLIITSIAATGAGLHVAAYYIEGNAQIGPLSVLISVAVPVSLYIGLVYTLYTYLVGYFDRFHLLLLGGNFGFIFISLIAAALGCSVAACLLILTLAPAVTVVGYELLGHQHQADILTVDFGSSHTFRNSLEQIGTGRENG